MNNLLESMDSSEKKAANSATDSDSEIPGSDSFDNSEEDGMTFLSEDACQSLYSLNLKEYSPLTHLLNSIPAKAQRGFDSYNLLFTCIDAAPDFIAIGTNIGTLFLYDRRDGTLERLRHENYIGAVTAITSQTQENYLLAFGFESGVISAVNVLLNENSLQINSRISIVDEHHSAITCLEWGTDFPELYSGDRSGLVVHSSIDFSKKSAVSSPLLGEPYEIVQISYISRLLAVSTTMRTIVCQIMEDSCLRCPRIQVGKRERKKPGPFGVVFDPKTRNFDNPLLYTSRPGTRLWKSDSSGEVIETMLLNESLERLPNETICLLQSDAKLGIHRVHSRKKPQIEKLKMFQNLFVVAWNDDGVFIADPDIRSVVASCQGLQKLKDVAVSRDEIFLLQGDRYVRRVATCPEDALYPGRTIKTNPAEELFPFSNFLSPFQELGSSFKGTPNKLDQTDSSPIPVFGWLKEKLKRPESAVTNNANSNVDFDLPPVVDLKINGPVEIGLEADEESNYVATLLNSDQTSIASPSRGVRSRIQTISEVEVPEELIFQPKKKKKSKGKSKKGSVDSTSSEVLIETGLTELCLISTASNTIPSVTLNESDLVQPAGCISDKSVPIDVPSSSPSGSPSYEIGSLQTELFQNNDEGEDERLAKILSLYSRSRLESPVSEATPSVNEIIQDPAVNQEDSDTVDGISKNENTSSFPKDDLPDTQGSTDSVNMDQEEEDSFCETDDRRADSDIYRFASPTSKMLDLPSPDVDIYSEKIDSSNQDNSLLQLDLDDEDDDDDSDLISAASETIGSVYDWIRHPTPGPIVSLSLSQNFLYVTNGKEELYYSSLKGLVLVWKNGNVQAQEVSVSPSGRFLSTLHKGNLKFTVLRESGRPSKQYADLAKNVINAALDDDRAWYITSDGKCFYQKWYESSKTFNDPQSLPLQFTPKKLSAHSGLLWVLSDSGKIYCRSGISNSNPDGLDWVEVPFSCENSPYNLTLGGNGRAWVVDTLHSVWVKKGVDRSCPVGQSEWYQVETQAHLIQESGRQKGIKMLYMSADKLGSVFTGHAKPCLASNEKGCWFGDAVGPHLLSSRGDVVAHSWTCFQPNRNVASSKCKWALISASVLATISDLIWAVYQTGELFCIRSSELISVPLPDANPNLKIVDIAPVNDMLWIVMDDGSIFIRNTIIPTRPQGLCWTPYQDVQLDGIRLVSISCSTNVIWACDFEGGVWCRVGPVMKSNKLKPAWILINEIDEVNVPGMAQVKVGPACTMVWALNSNGFVYVRDGVTTDMPIGTAWILVPGLLVISLSLSASTVWVVSEDGEIYWRCGIEASNPSGDAWIRIPGSFQAVTATHVNELWTLDKEGILYVHQTVRIDHTPGESIHAIMKDLVPEVEEDWEVV